jgi:hypothetical protein
MESKGAARTETESTPCGNTASVLSGDLNRRIVWNRSSLDLLLVNHYIAPSLS